MSQGALAEMRRDFYIGAFSLIIGLSFYLWLIPLWVEKPDYGVTSPRMFPNFAAIASIVIGVCLILKNYKGIKSNVSSGMGRIFLEGVFWLLVAILTVLGISHVGFIVANALICFICMLLAGQRKHLIPIALFCVIFPILLNQIAIYVFDVALP
ncbi:MAG: tripartite tricarboxylate transporter TctB family protein [Oceanospirillaceae bacterium]|nr:tripartite tricarboxylate transporter TctB family protein [Oceanospirillaceae bacterium]